MNPEFAPLAHGESYLLLGCRPVDSVDIVIVGAGSAGCVLANRLSEDPSTRVLLLEAGPRDHRVDWRLHMPAALAWPLMGRRYNWAYESEPEPHASHRRMYCPRGRVLGGSSSINGMVYIRGNPLDYEYWATQEGLANWSYSHCLPYFRRAETRLAGADEYRGGDGPLKVTTGSCENPLFRAFIEAGQQAGFAYTADVNGYQQEGVGPFDRTTWRGRRWSTASAYLRPTLRRKNLTVLTGASAQHLTFERSRVSGVTYRHRGSERTVLAGEVIVTAGAINSPQLLQLSGVGPANLLRKYAIDIRADVAGVGANLQDHLEAYVQTACTQPVSLYPALRPWNQLRLGVEWLFFRRGLGASNQFEAGGFTRTDDRVTYPNLQYHFLPVAMNYDGSNPRKTHGYQLHVGPMRSDSRGHVQIRSSNPSDPPAIQFNYLSTEQDEREWIAAIRQARHILAQPAFDAFRGDELSPGSDVQSDADILQFVRDHAESAYHPSGTCKMGAGPDAVTDAEHRVYGTENLRVVDASIMPRIVTGNLNAPTIMIAEKAADTILGNTPLRPSPAPYFAHGTHSGRTGGRPGGRLDSLAVGVADGPSHAQ